MFSCKSVIFLREPATPWPLKCYPGFWAALHFIYLLDLLDLLDLLGYLCYLIYLIYLDILRFIPSNFWDKLLFNARQRFALLLHLCLVETPDVGVEKPWAFLVGKSSTNVGFPQSSIMIYLIYVRLKEG